MIIASNTGEVQFISVREARSCTEPIHMGIFEVLDLKITSDSQYLLIAYSSGVVNVHHMGDKTNSFVC